MKHKELIQKRFNCHLTRNTTFSNHQILYNFGLSPSSFFPHDDERTIGMKYYCFLMEKVKTFPIELNRNIPDFWRNVEFHLGNTIRKIRSIGYWMPDVHFGNFGLTKENKVVVIDVKYLYRLGEDSVRWPKDSLNEQLKRMYGF